MGFSSLFGFFGLFGRWLRAVPGRDVDLVRLPALLLGCVQLLDHEVSLDLGKLRPTLLGQGSRPALVLDGGALVGNGGSEMSLLLTFSIGDHAVTLATGQVDDQGSCRIAPRRIGRRRTGS